MLNLEVGELVYLIPFVSTVSYVNFIPEPGLFEEFALGLTPPKLTKTLGYSIFAVIKSSFFGV